MKNAFAVVAAATLVLGGVLGLGLSPQAHVALASTGAPAPAVTATPAGAQSPPMADRPSYAASIQVPNAPDGAEDAKPGKDGVEAAQLATQAKITAEQAKNAALAAVPGQVVKTELDNENGNLVYSVEVKDASGTAFDVKVDAGDGRILAREQGGAGKESEGTENKGIESESKSGTGTDTDAVELEQQGEH